MVLLWNTGTTPGLTEWNGNEFGMLMLHLLAARGLRFHVSGPAHDGRARSPDVWANELPARRIQTTRRT
jgi:hypothetical protein